MTQSRSRTWTHGWQHFKERHFAENTMAFCYLQYTRLLTKQVGLRSYGCNFGFITVKERCSDYFSQRGKTRGLTKSTFCSEFSYKLNIFAILTSFSKFQWPNIFLLQFYFDATLKFPKIWWRLLCAGLKKMSKSSEHTTIRCSTKCSNSLPSSSKFYNGRSNSNYHKYFGDAKCQEEI